MVDRFIARRDILTSNNSIAKRTGRSVDSRKTVRRSHALLALSAAAGIAGIFSASSAKAANAEWDGGSTTDGQWNDVANWVGGAPPGATTGTTNTDIATFDLAIANNWGLIGTPIVIDSASENIGGINFDTSAGNYFIGSTTGNPLLLTASGTIQILSSLSATNAVETINAPLVIEGAAANFTFANNSANGTGAGAGTLDFNGAISGGTAGATTLTLSGTNTNVNTISGIISNGTSTSMSVVMAGTGIWDLTGASTYNGVTNINSGTLQVGNSLALGNSRVNIATGATLDLHGTNLNLAFINNGGVALAGGVIDNVSAGGNITLTVGGGQGGVNATSANYTANDTYSGIIKNTTGVVSLTKVSPTVANQTVGIMATASLLNGPDVLRLTNQNTYSGPTTVKGGFLDINFGNSNNGGTAVTSAILPATGLVLAGGDMIMEGQGSINPTQALGGLTINSGASHIANYRNGSTTFVLNIGGISRNSGGTLDFQNRPSGSSSNAKLGAADGTDNTTTADANFTGGSATILGGYATFNGTTWAASASNGTTSAAITALATFSTTYAAGTNVDSPIGTSTPASMTINSLRFNTAGAYTVNTGGDLTVATGGILETTTVGANAVAINNNNLISNNGQDLIVIQNNGNASGAMTIGSNIIGTTGLTKSGIGNLTLTPNTANTFSGPLTINAGTIVLGNSNALSSSTPVPVVFGGTSQTIGGTTPTFVLANGTLNLSGHSLTVASLTSSTDSSGTAIVQNASATPATLTVNGSINTVFSGNLQDGTGGGSLGLIKNGSSVFTLAGTNTYTGNTTVSGGTLALKSLPSSTNYSIAASSTLDITGVTGSLLTLTSGKTLSGSGTLLGSVVENSNATITPGSNGAGTLTLNKLTVNSGANLIFGLDGTTPNPTNNLIDVTTAGGLVFSGTFAAGGFSLFQPGSINPVTSDGTYDLLQYTGTAPSVAGLSSASITNPVSGLTYNWQTNTIAGNNYVQLVIGGTPTTSAIWLFNGSGNWADGTKWSTNPTPPNSAGSSASLATALTGAATIDLGSTNETVGTVKFNSQSLTNGYTIASTGGGKLILDNAANGSAMLTQDFGSVGNLIITAPLVLNSNVTANVLSGNTLTISGGISRGTASAPAFTKSGTGTAVLSNTNAYTGGTFITAGILQFKPNSLGSGGITINGGTLQWGSSTTDDISTQTVTIGANGATLDTNGNNVTINNPIGNSGTGGLTKAGTGTLTFAPTANNTYSGGTTISGGILNFSTIGNLASGGITLNTGGTLQWASGTTTDISTMAVTPAGGVLDANGSVVTFANAIGNSSTGALTLTSAAAGGGFTLNQPSTYSGNTTISATSPASVNVTLNQGATLGSGSIIFQGNNGTITSAYTGLLGLPSINVPSGASGTITGSSRTTIGGLTGSGTLNVVSTVLPTLLTATFNGVGFVAGDFSTFSGTINMSSNSTANNAVVLAFNNGGNNFNGNMSLATVNLINNVRLSSTNNSTGNTWTVGAIQGDSTSIIAGADYPGTAVGLTILVGGNNANTTFGGQITNGDGGVSVTALTKQGTGVLTLTNANPLGSSSYTGATIVNAGTLRVTNTSGCATGYGTVTINNGGTLAGTGIISGQAAPSPVSTVVTVADGGTITPDHYLVNGVANNVGPISSGSIPTLTLDALTLNAATGASAPILNFELTAPASPNPNGSTPGTSDLINVTQGGSLNINSGIVNVFDSTTGAVFSTPGTYNLMEYNSGVGGSGVGALSLGAAELAVPNVNYLLTAPGGANPFIQLVISANPTNFWTNGTGDSTWNPGDTGNWSSGVVPSSSTAIADFDDSHYHVPGAAQNVTLGSTIILGQLIFNSTPKVTIGSGNINFDNGSAAAVISDTKGTHSIAANLNLAVLGLNVGVTNASDSLTISGQIAGSGPLSTSGAGNITFAGALNTTAFTVNSTGTVILATDNSGLNGATTVNSGTLALLNQNSLASSVVGLTGTGLLNFAPGVGTYFLGGITTGNIAMQDTASGTVNLDVGGPGASFTYSGVLNGAGNLIKDGGGTMTLTQANLFTGNVTVNNGTVVVGANPAYGTASTVTTLGQNTTLTVNPADSFGGTLVMQNNSTLNIVGTTSTGTFVGNNITVASGATITVESTLASSNGYAGIITFDPSGNSTVTINGNMGTGATTPQVSFSSGTTQFANNGTFVVPGGQNLRWSSTALNNGSPNVLFDIEGTMTTRNQGAVALGAIEGGGTLTSGTAAGEAAGATVVYSIGAQTAVGTGTPIDSTFNGNITDADATHLTAITKVGSSTLTLANNNTYTGNTTVTAGTLVIPSGNSIDSGNVIATGGVLDLTGTLNGTATALPNVSASGTGIINADNNNNQNGSPFARNWGTVTVGTGATGGRINLTNSPNGQVNRTVLIVGSSTVPGTTTFTAGGTGVLDLNSNDMIVKGAGTAGRATLATAAASGLAGPTGAWTGTGLVTSSGLATANHNINTGLAIVVNDTNQSGTLSGTQLMGTFDGQSVSDGDVLVKYTYFGDALLTGSVTASDYIQIDNGFASQSGANPLQGWYNGDFNYDGKINGDDYTLIDNAFNTQAGVVFPTSISAGPAEMIATNTSQISGVASPASVPEPTTLTMLGIGAAGLLTRRRRRNA
jgi:fibronectin-binding autotransporter adhesin